MKDVWKRNAKTPRTFLSLFDCVFALFLIFLLSGSSSGFSLPRHPLFNPFLLGERDHEEAIKPLFPDAAKERTNLLPIDPQTFPFLGPVDGEDVLSSGSFKRFRIWLPQGLSFPIFFSSTSRKTFFIDWWRKNMENEILLSASTFS